MAQMNVQYILDAKGNNTAVIIPIKMWHDILAENETTYLLKSETMRKRLLNARNRQETIPYEVVREKLGL